MPITTLYFFILVLAAVLVYYLLPRQLQWKFLLAVSLVFYSLFAGIRAALFLLAAVVTAYGSGVFMEQAGANKRKRQLVFWMSFSVLFGLLFAFQYLNFVLRNLNPVLETIFKIQPFPLTEWMPPLGISFFTLSLLSYIIDVYWEIQKPQKNIAKFSLFGFYFPQLTSGPIVRYREMEQKLYEGHQFCYETVVFGMQRVLWGCFKKLVIADRLGLLVSQVYGNYSQYTGLELIGVTFAGTMRLYLDFSSSMDIVLGISSLFGITLPENFRKPFSALSMAEFFQRWHITLGLWLKDYVFFPAMKSRLIQKLSGGVRKRFGKRAGKMAGTFSAMLALWICMGIWHGGTWKYILGIGVLWWFFMLLDELMEPFAERLCKRAGIDREKFWYRCLRRAKVVLEYSASIPFFFGSSLRSGIGIYQQILNGSAGLYENGFFTRIKSILISCYSKYDVLILVYAIFIWAAAVILDRKGSLQSRVAGLCLPFRWMVYYILLFSVLLFAANGTNVLEGFLYANF